MRRYVRYDRIFRGMVTAFSYTVPLFMINLGLQTHVKFYQSLPITWTSFVVCLMGVLVWYRCHSALVSHLLWQPRGSSGMQGEMEESGRWDRGRSGSYALSEESGVAHYRGMGWQGDSGSRGTQCWRSDADRRGLSPARRGSVTRSESLRSVRRDPIARSESPWSDQESSVASAASSVAEFSEIHQMFPQHLLISSGVRMGEKEAREVGM